MKRGYKIRRFKLHNKKYKRFTRIDREVIRRLFE